MWWSDRRLQIISGLATAAGLTMAIITPVMESHVIPNQNPETEAASVPSITNPTATTTSTIRQKVHVVIPADTTTPPPLVAPTETPIKTVSTCSAQEDIVNCDEFGRSCNYLEFDGCSINCDSNCEGAEVANSVVVCSKKYACQGAVFRNSTVDCVHGWSCRFSSFYASHVQCSSASAVCPSSSESFDACSCCEGTSCPSGVPSCFINGAQDNFCATTHLGRTCTDWGNPICKGATVPNKVIFTVTTTNAQDALIIASAGLSFIKSLLAVGTYSYFHVVFAILELACTGMALVLFILQDYKENDHGIYGNDIHLYFMSFVSACIIEVVDFIITYQTVRSYKRLKELLTRRVLLLLKKQASCTHITGLVFAILSCAIVPLIAFSKAHWETDYFTPTGFTSKNSLFLTISLSITLACQAIQIFFSILNMANFMCVFVSCSIFLQPLSLASSILYMIVLSRVSGKEAGGFTYLTMINAAQVVEIASEMSRHAVWSSTDRDASELLKAFQSRDPSKTGQLPLEIVRQVFRDGEDSKNLPEGVTEAVLTDIDNNGDVCYVKMVDRLFEYKYRLSSSSDE